jgi:hypothetical protein
MHRIEVDMDKTCKECGHAGACQNGSCIKCSSEVVLRRLREKLDDPSHTKRS